MLGVGRSGDRTSIEGGQVDVSVQGFLSGGLGYHKSSGVVGFHGLAVAVRRRSSASSSTWPMSGVNVIRLSAGRSRRLLTW